MDKYDLLLIAGVGASIVGCGGSDKGTSPSATQEPAQTNQEIRQDSLSAQGLDSIVVIESANSAPRMEVQTNLIDTMEAHDSVIFNIYGESTNGEPIMAIGVEYNGSANNDYSMRGDYAGSARIGFKMSTKEGPRKFRPFVRTKNTRTEKPLRTEVVLEKDD